MDLSDTYVHKSLQLKKNSAGLNPSPATSISIGFQVSKKKFSYTVSRIVTRIL